MDTYRKRSYHGVLLFVGFHQRVVLYKDTHGTVDRFVCLWYRGKLYRFLLSQECDIFLYYRTMCSSWCVVATVVYA
jgi:hypothetical protein